MRTINIKREIKHFNEIEKEMVKFENECVFVLFENCNEISTKLRNYTNVTRLDDNGNRDEFYTVNVDCVKKIDENKYEMYVSRRWRSILDEKIAEEYRWLEKSYEDKANDLINRGVNSKIVDIVLEKLNYDEIKSLEIVNISDEKEFAEELILTDHHMEHSWAGDERTLQTAEILIGEDIFFGKDISYRYYDNGNLTNEEDKTIEPDFNIKGEYCILKNTIYRTDYNRNYADDKSYKIINYKKGE